MEAKNREENSSKYSTDEKLPSSELERYSLIGLQDSRTNDTWHGSTLPNSFSFEYPSSPTAAIPSSLMSPCESCMESRSGKSRIFRAAFGLLALVIMILLLMWIVSLQDLGSNGVQFLPETPLYNHDMVSITLGSSGDKCQYVRSCLPYCESVEVEHQVGCCTGCGIPYNCNFNVTVHWKNVPAKKIPQFIWLLVTLDGSEFYQTGYAPAIGILQSLDNSSSISNNSKIDPSGTNSIVNSSATSNGEAVISDACFSTADQVIAIVACMSTSYMQDATFDGFPASECISSWGLCVATNNVFQDLPDFCSDEQWIGNSYTSNWLGPIYSDASILSSHFGINIDFCSGIGIGILMSVLLVLF
jgi:hypothetical protein